MTEPLAAAVKTVIAAAEAATTITLRVLMFLSSRPEPLKVPTHIRPGVPTAPDPLSVLVAL
jgi:hypothetical protein